MRSSTLLPTRSFSFVGALLLLGSIVGYSQVPVTYTDTATVSWDAVTSFVSGVPFAPTDIVDYQVARSADPVLDRNTPDETLATVSGLSTIVTQPPDQTIYVYAVRTRVTTDEGQTILNSAWNWSDQNGTATPVPFVYRHPTTVPPNLPQGFTGS